MSGSVRFGHFEFDPDRGELRKHGLRIRVPGQSLTVLAALLESPGEIVTRVRIQSALWPNGTAVGFEQSINAAVKKLRVALGDPANRPRFVERVPRRGYRFMAPVERLSRAAPDGAPDSGIPALPPQYKLLEKAGSGSMGEVWKAEDTKLGRTVALKFVPRRLADDPGRLVAFRQEARHAAALNHPNICTIYGLEECGGHLFLAMEYIDGESLTAALDDAPLACRRIVDTGTQAAEALAAAHAAGVIHRDVKPANLMLTKDGRVKLTDFGIATVAREGELPQAACANRTPAGTLGYLSPEQARGERADARSDLFSLGVVLYEMATGRRPFRGDTPQAVLQAIRDQQPVRPRALNSGLPRELEAVILRALAKDPDARWQSAHEVAKALQRIGGRQSHRRMATAAAVVAFVAAALALWLWKRPAPALAERDLIVVADFENKTGDGVFDGSLRQAVLTQAGQSSYLRVLSEERIRQALILMGQSPGGSLSRGVALELCQRTGAKATLAGSIGLVAKRYFVGLEAIACADGELLGSEYAEAQSKEKVLAAVTLAVSRMRGRLGESLGSIRKLGSLPEAATTSLEALQAYDVALREKAAGNDPVPLLDRAIKLDPEFGGAYFTLARIYLGRSRDAEAEGAISKAFALREHASQKERIAIEGLYHQIVTGDAVQGVALSGLASRLYPHDSSTWRWSVIAHVHLGHSDKALELARREVEAAPDDGISYFDVAVVLAGLGKTAEAASVLDRAEARGAGSEMFPFVRYILAELAEDSAAMERETEAARGKPFENRIRMLETQTAGFRGQLAKARKIAGDSLDRKMNGAPALQAVVALTEATFGFEREARARAQHAIRLDRGRRTGATSALTLALTREPVEAASILADLLRRYPNDTLLNKVWAPAVGGAIALAGNDAREAVRITEAPPHLARFAWPQYIRGLAYLRLGLASKAVAEFRTIVARKTELLTGAFAYGAAFAYPAAQLGLARALAMEGQLDASRKQYGELLALWKQADPGIPIFIQAKAEYAALPLRPARRISR